MWYGWPCVMTKHETLDQAVNIVTSAPATATGVTVGAITAWLISNAPVIISLMTMLLLAFQLIAWVYRIYGKARKAVRYRRNKTIAEDACVMCGAHERYPNGECAACAWHPETGWEESK